MHDRVGVGECPHAGTGLEPDARVQAGLEERGDQRPAERERAALDATGERVAVDLPGRELDVGDGRRDVRRVAHERRHAGRRIERERLQGAAALLAAALELGVVVGVRDRLPAQRRLALEPLGDRPGLVGEHLQERVVRVAERERPQVRETLLGRVVRHVPVGGEPADPAREGRRAADVLVRLEQR